MSKESLCGRIAHVEGAGACPAPAAMPPEPDLIDTRYLRAAQAYMLISMPTDTSTIFGVFQVIRLSQEFDAN
jgi:hypothetical protein